VWESMILMRCIVNPKKWPADRAGHKLPHAAGAGDDQ
jgi:hypothetical protein